MGLGDITLGIVGKTVTIWPKLTICRIQDVVAAYYSINPAHMQSKSKDWCVAHPRQVAMYLARELTRNSLPEIGRRFGGKHHSTVLHAWREVEQRRRSQADTAEDIRILRGSLVS